MLEASGDFNRFNFLHCVIPRTEDNGVCFWYLYTATERKGADKNTPEIENGCHWSEAPAY